MAISKVSDINSHFNNLYDQTSFVTREYELMPNLVTLRNGVGMSPRILTSYTSTSATTVAEGGTPSSITFAKTSHGTVTPEIAIYYGILTDERIATDPQDAIDDLSMEAGMALGKQVDQKLIAEFANFTHTSGTAATALTLAEVQIAMAYLANSNAVGPRFGVIGAGQWLQLSKEITSTGAGTFQGNYGELANEAMREYFAGQFLGATWFQNSNIGTTGTAGTATGGLFTRRAIVLDERSIDGNTFLVQEENRPRHGGRWDITWRYRRGSGVDHASEGVKLVSHNAIS